MFSNLPCPYLIVLAICSIFVLAYRFSTTSISISKETVVTICQYSLHYNSERFDFLNKFRAERYLDHPLKAGQYVGLGDPYARDHFGFGAGRRICPDMHLAENSLYITLSMLIWAFEMRPTLDADGQEEFVATTDSPYVDTANNVPKPCKIRFMPRNEQRRKVIEKGGTRL